MGVHQAPEAGSFLEGTNPLPGPQAEQRVAGEGSSRLRTLCVWRLSSGGRGPLCAQGMGKLSLAGTHGAAGARVFRTLQALSGRVQWTAGSGQGQGRV